LELKKNIQNDHDEPVGQFTEVNNRCALRPKNSKRCFHYVNSDAGQLPENSR
jgi:hypothetical protein